MRTLAQIFLLSGGLATIAYIAEPCKEYLLVSFIYGLIGITLVIIDEAFIKTNTSS